MKNKAIMLLSFISLFVVNGGLAQRISLSDFTNFDRPSEGWQISEDLQINPLSPESIEIIPGDGIVVGSAVHDSDINVNLLSTKKTFGAVSVEFDFMLSHGSLATIWLQKAYGIKLLDGWGEMEKAPEQHGAIVPPNIKGVLQAGYLPSNNVSRAPGIWQHIRIVFTPPNWNEDGVKVSPAKFESVEINGTVVHEGQYLPSPSFNAPQENESVAGPLAFQVDKGHFAIRNLHYVEYSDNQVQIVEGSYKLYLQKFLDDEFIYWGGNQDGKIDLPDIRGLKADESERIERINTRMVREKSNDFALVYEGQLGLPVSGIYKFDIVANGVGKFELNSEELARWDALRNSGKTNVAQKLEAGKIPFKLIYYNVGTPSTGLFVEGPGIRKHPLHDSHSIPAQSIAEPITLTPGDKPIIQRSFLYHEDHKLLSVVNVGYSEGIHYSYNFATGGLIQSWRGKFGETTEMWHGRGEAQVLQPLGNVLQLDGDQQLFIAENDSINVEESLYRRVGYSLNNQEEPVFSYQIADILVKDHIQPKEHHTISRHLQLHNQNKDQQNVIFKVAKADQVERISKNLYSIDDSKYFVEIHSDVTPIIIREDNYSQLLIPLNLNSELLELSYSILW